MPDDVFSRPFFLRSDFLRTGAAAIAAGIAGCSGGGSSPGNGTVGGGSATPTPVPTASTNPDAVSITVGTTSSGAIMPGFVGLSYEKEAIAAGLFVGSNAPLAGCFSLLGKSVLRIGGNTVDTTTWTPSGSGGVLGQAAPSDVQGLAAFAALVGWKVIYGINLATNTPQNAAAEAAFVVQTLGTSLYGFEIGNQPDLYAANNIRSSSYTYADFLSEWQSYVSAILGSAPGASITGPAVSSENISTWTVPFAAAEGSELKLLTQHYYRDNGLAATATLSELLATDPKLQGDFQLLRAAAAGSQIAGGYRIAECNSFYNGGALGVSDAYGSALWALDLMMVGAENSCAGFNFHGGGDTDGYTPLADANGALVGVRPEFYGLLLAAQIPSGTMLKVTTETTLPVTAYAVSGSGGANALILINKGASAAADASITLQSSAASGTVLALTGTGLDATAGTLLGGATVSLSGAWSPNPPTNITIGGSHLQLSIPAATALLVLY